MTSSQAIPVDLYKSLPHPQTRRLSPTPHPRPRPPCRTAILVATARLTPERQVGHRASPQAFLPVNLPAAPPSMSAGTSGGKLITATKDGKKATPPNSTSASTVTPARPAKPASVHSDSGLSHKFNLKDLLASGPKLNRRPSASSRRSDSEVGSDGGKGRTKSTAGDSATSLTQKYGVCQKVAIGKGATSVVRLAHKWDRAEEKLYAVKVSIVGAVITHICSSMMSSNSELAARMRRRRNMLKSSPPNSASPLPSITPTSSRPSI